MHTVFRSRLNLCILKTGTNAPSYSRYVPEEFIWTLKSYESQDSGVVMDHLDMPDHAASRVIEEAEEESPESEVRKLFFITCL